MANELASQTIFYYSELDSHCAYHTFVFVLY